MSLSNLEQLRCKWRFDRLLSAHLDHELSGSDAARVSEHLRGCARCQNEWERLSRAKRVMGQFEIPTPRYQWARPAAETYLASNSDTRIRRLLTTRISIPLPLAAALVLAIGTGMFFTSIRSEDKTAELNQPQIVEQTRIVEVPVERERVVVRYVEPGKEKTVRRQKSPNSEEPKNSSEASAQRMEDFRPASSANLRVVKEPGQ